VKKEENGGIDEYMGEGRENNVNKRKMEEGRCKKRGRIKIRRIR
jgi:hypothetical protein